MHRWLFFALATASRLTALSGHELLTVPLYFEPNRGQFDPAVQFAARGGGLTMFLTADATVLRTAGKDAATVRMKFEGSRITPSLEPLELQPGVSHYYRGADPARWRTHVPHYASVLRRGIYPGIDLAYHSSGRRIEYDFIVAPGADPNSIRLAYDGAGKIRVDAKGDLILATGAGDLRQHKPLVYQERGARRIEIAASYRVRGLTVTFDLARYDNSLPLVIDPVLAYGSFLGGSGHDIGREIGLDASGSIYAAGQTVSANFPLQSASDSTVVETDAFVTKLSANGQTLIYSTYLGGSGDEYVNGFSVQSSGNAFVAGATSSADFPTLSAFQASARGLLDGFVTKLSPAGTFVYSTYLGGSLNDSVNGVSVDATGNAFLAGQTNSPNFPGTSAPLAIDAFIARLDPAGSTLGFAKLIGGSGDDSANAIAIDATGIYLAGGTDSTNFPAAAAGGAIQPTAGAAGDAFVVKARLDGIGLIYSSYLGGAGSDVASSIAIDSSGNAYVAGRTRSLDFPVRTPLFPAPASRFSTLETDEAFLAKVNSTGTALVYSTYFGGSSDDSPQAVAVDSAGRATIAGFTSSTDLPVYAAFQSLTTGPGRSGFVARFDSAGSALDYCTYYAGADTAVHGVSLDSSGGTWITGSEFANPIDQLLPVPLGFDQTANGNYDAFLAKLTGAVTVSVTVNSNPSGRKVIVDGRTVTTPFVTAWVPGTQHTLNANSPQADNQFFFTFSSWSDSGSATHAVTANTGQTYTVNYTSAACAYSAVPASVNAGFEGGSFDVQTTSIPSVCPVAPVSASASWLSAQPDGFARGLVHVLILPNTGGPRSAVVDFGGASFAVTQTGGSAGLAAPVVTSPAAGQVLQVTGASFQWTPVSGANGWDIRVLGSQYDRPTVQNFAVFRGSLSGANSTSILVDLPGQYVNYFYFYVRACAGGFDDAHCGPFSNPGSVRLDLPAPFPGAPTILAPASGTTLTSSTQEFRWVPIPGATRYNVLLHDGTGYEMQITTPATSTVYSLKGAPFYNLTVRACAVVCAPIAASLGFLTNLPAVPTAAPSITAVTPVQVNSYRFDWTPVSGADIYRIHVIQPNAGPGGGALTVASAQTAVLMATLSLPAGAASAIVTACTGRGCGPFSASVGINVSGPNPSAPVLGQPISVTNVDGPGVLFTWSRIPGDNGSNVPYRLFVADLSRSATALDVLTTNNFYAAQFSAQGRRYDAVVAASPGPGQIVGAPAGFIVQGANPLSPTLVAPAHESSVRAGNIQLGWTPIGGDSAFGVTSFLYHYAVYKLGESQPVAEGQTTGQFALVPLAAQGGAPTRYSAIVRACAFTVTNPCIIGSGTQWGPWSNEPNQPGVTNFTVLP